MNKVKNSASAVLKTALNLIASPENWTKGAGARNAHGVPVSVDDSQAVCFCSMGAMDRAIEILDMDYSVGIYDYLYKNIPTNHTNLITSYNDAESTTHDDVVNFFKIAIQKAEEDEASKSEEQAS